MSGHQKEVIFVELRQYHLDEFPASLSSPELNLLHEEFKLLEDEVVNMVLGVINGKVEFEDKSNQLNDFGLKLEEVNNTADSKTDKQLFADKVTHLKKIMEIARKAGFPLRRQRPPRISKSTKSITTESNI